MPSITYFIRTFRRNQFEIFPAEVHEHIDLGQAWEFFRGYATHDSADLYSRIELVERDWEDLSERVLGRCRSQIWRWLPR